jgi:hypothetical protein
MAGYTHASYNVALCKADEIEGAFDGAANDKAVIDLKHIE